LSSFFAPSDFVTIGLLIALEGLLSADNAMVLAILVLGLPKAQQKKALKYGIVGAFAFRTIATLLAAYMIQLGWVKLVGAGYLLYLVYRHFGGREAGVDRHTPPRAEPWLGLSAFWATVVKVELTDIVFAIDSILVAVAMSPKRWVILTGGLLGIVMMRLVIGKLLALVERYPLLVDGAFVIIAWVGIKLLIEYAHSGGYIGFEIPKFISLGVIVVIFGVTLTYALIRERQTDASRHTGLAADRSGAAAQAAAEGDRH
jgi:YkoY family integral membrane protein